MMTLMTINRVYYLIGFVVMLLVIMTLRDRGNPKRFTTALFWFLFGGIFLFGDLMVQELVMLQEEAIQKTVQQRYMQYGQLIIIILLIIIME